MKFCLDCALRHLLARSSASIETYIVNLHGVSKTIQGILSGIGFLGAGVIMRLQGKDEVHGITTASSIWLSAIIGMICAMGEGLLGFATFGIAWVVLVFGSWLEFQIIRSVAAKPIIAEPEKKMDPKSEAQFAASNVETHSRSDRRLMGKQIRDKVPRSDHATWEPFANRPTVQDLLIESNRDRLSNLVPIRHGRMKGSPLAFFRGLALAMAKDLANTPNTGILLPICGDCHLQNLGWFATPERNLVFDLTDFDETTTGCWEWDLKRLVTSFVLAVRELGLGHSHQLAVVHQVARAYRENMAVYEAFEPLQMWYQKIDAKSVLAHAKLPDSQARMEKAIAAAKSRTVEALLPRITKADPRNPDKRQFMEQPPILSRHQEGVGFIAETESLIRAYVLTLSDGRSELFQRYKLSDMAMKVVGVGSVGLRCGILLFEDSDGAPLVLQIKEARPSIFATFATDAETSHEGYRVVHGQRLVQAASDLFLGWTADSKGRHYYLRQLRDMKLSIDLLHSDSQSLLDYGQLCGWALARAHAKSGKASYIAGYLGTGDQFDFALEAFGLAYADQVESDFLEFKKLVSSGTIPVEIA